MEGKIFETIEEPCSIEGADVNLKDDESGDTRLHFAAKVANVDLIRHLITQGADVNAKNSKTGRTPLHSVFLTDQNFNDRKLSLAQVDALEVLLSAGADVNAVDFKSSDTPLHFFFDNYLYEHNDRNETFFKIVKIFLKHRVDFKMKNKYGSTPIDTFLRNCHLYNNFNYPSVLLDTLIKYGLMDVDSLFVAFILEKGTLLHASCYSLNYKLMKFLVDYGADIDVVNEYGDTPLVDLIIGFIKVGDGASDHCKILDYFLSFNPDVNVRTNEGLNILNLAYDRDDDMYPEFLWKALIEYIAKKQSTGYLLHEDIAQTIYQDTCYGYQSYLEKCAEELKSLRLLKFSWLNLNDILMDRKKKLDCYAKNKELVKEFNELSLAQTYPIYGTHISKKFSKAVQKQEIKEKSAAILSSCLPCNLDPSHLVIRKILNYVKVKYLRYLCEPESEELQLKIKTDKEMNEFRISLDKYFCDCYKIE